MKLSKSNARRAVWSRVPPSISAPRRLRSNDSTLTVFQSIITQGDRVFDVGANRGDFSYVASVATGSTGSVVAFEPNALYFAQLQRLSQSQANIDFVASAISDAGCIVELTIPVDESGSPMGWLSTAETSDYTNTTRQFCPATSLDVAASTIGYPDVVKIDVEGHESTLIDGASDVLAKCRSVLIEVEARHVGVDQAAATVERLRSMFDRAFFVRDGQKVAVDEFDFQTHQLDLLSSANLPGEHFQTQALDSNYVSDFLFERDTSTT